MSPKNPPRCPEHGTALVCPACNGARGGKVKGGRKGEKAGENMRKALDRRWPNGWKDRRPVAALPLPPRCPACGSSGVKDSWCYCNRAMPHKRR